MRDRTNQLTVIGALAALASVLFLFVCAIAPLSAYAGSYRVLACDAHTGQPGVSANRSWELSATPGHSAESLCPSGGNAYRGIATRIISSVSAGTFERATINAPAGTTITELLWNGRGARGNCTWAAELRARPSDQTIIGYKPHQNCNGTSFDYAATLSLGVPAGTTQIFQNVQCGAGNCPAGASFHTFGATVTINDPYGPGAHVTGGGLGGGGWIAGTQRLSFFAGDNVGIREAALTIDGSFPAGKAFHCDYTFVTPCSNQGSFFDYETERVPDGPHIARLTFTDAADNSDALERTFRVDNHAPEPVEAAVAGGEGWRTSNGFTVSWPNVVQEFAPITRAHYRLCDPDGECSEGSRSGAAITEISNLPVQKLGDSTLKVWLEDEAGNNSSFGARPMHLRLDPEAPSLEFLPQDPSDPLTVAVRATDGYSGVASGEIEMRRKDGQTWHTLPTKLEGDRLLADVDDERFRSGVFEFRAHATDHAGNEASTGSLADGAQASVQLPVRALTKLRAGFTRVKTKRKTVRRGGERHVVRRRVRVLVPEARVRFRRAATIAGRLVNLDGQPIDSATVAVLARRDLPGRNFTPAGFAQTDRQGRFRYRVRGVASRILRFQYEGSRRIHGSHRDVAVRVPAGTSVVTDRDRLFNGQTVTFRGRVLTQPIPVAGKLVEIQAFFRGRWRTISTTRSDRRGRWTFRYQFGATTGVVRYRFRALLSQEGGYPFATGHSRVVGVTVRGL